MHDEAALYVPPFPTAQQSMMTGRFYHLVLPQVCWCFFHETSESERGLNLAQDTHGGFDAAVIGFLLEQHSEGWLMVHHSYDAPTVQHVALFSTFLAYSEYVPDIDGRYRLFLAREHWIDIVQRVPERRLPRLDLPVLTHDPRPVLR